MKNRNVTILLLFTISTGHSLTNPLVAICSLFAKKITAAFNPNTASQPSTVQPTLIIQAPTVTYTNPTSPTCSTTKPPTIAITTHPCKSIRDSRNILILDNAAIAGNQIKRCIKA